MPNMFKKHPKRASIAAEIMGIISYVLNPITTLSTLQIVLFSAGFWIIYWLIAGENTGFQSRDESGLF